MYAEPERVDRFVAALLWTLKNHSDCIRDGWKQNRTHLVRELLVRVGSPAPDR
jgi:hypothetical protein